MYLKGDQKSYQIYSTGEYIKSALPNVKAFRGYAGYIVTYYGPTATGGGCADKAQARTEVSVQSVIQATKTAETLEPNGQLNEVLLTSEYNVSAGFLAFFSGQVTNKKSVQVIVQDIAAESAIDVLDATKMANIKSAAMPAGACERRVIVNAALTEGISKLYSEVGKEASASGYNVKVGGRFHNSSSEFQRQLYVRVETRDL